MKNFNHLKLPNLYIPGSGKSGTSTLHELLNEHPDICMSTRKEPHFWTDLNFKKYSDDDFKKYESLFNKKDSIYYGESSTGYFCFPEFISRIKDFYTTPPKFIIILRNPIDRIYSHYWWLKGIGSENKGFREAILKDFDIEPDVNNKLTEGNYKSYYQFGLYGKWMTKFINEFGSENIHIITTEDLKTNPLETLNSCFTFLGVNSLESLPEIKNNQTLILKYPTVYKNTKKLIIKENLIRNTIKIFIPKRYRQKLRRKLYETVIDLTNTNKPYPKISVEDRLWLKNLYEKDVKILKEITQLKYNHWKDFN